MHAIEVLLPWHVAGVLDRATARRVDEALMRDPGLAARYAAVQDEWAATVRVIEDLGVPSQHVWHRVLAAIDAEPPRAGAVRERSRPDRAEAPEEAPAPARCRIG